MDHETDNALCICTGNSARPVAAKGEDAEREKAFVDTFITMKLRNQPMLSLSLASLDRMAIPKELKAIGGR